MECTKRSIEWARKTLFQGLHSRCFKTDISMCHNRSSENHAYHCGWTITSEKAKGKCSFYVSPWTMEAFYSVLGHENFYWASASKTQAFRLWQILCFYTTKIFRSFFMSHFKIFVQFSWAEWPHTRFCFSVEF